MLHISQLFIYPIKSLGGIAIEKAIVTETGLKYDRRWMLVDENQCFLSQRELPEMALLKVAIENNGLRITRKLLGHDILIPFTDDQDAGEEVEVTIWDDTCNAVYVSKEADEWFTAILGLKCRLVYMPEGTRRKVDPDYEIKDNITSFSDAFPFLIIGQSSLDDLNNRLIEKLSIDRFRPNIVFTGGEAFQEDKMSSFSVRDINFYGVKLCARCIIPTINQDDASKKKEPLKTLASYRSANNKIYFGQNLLHKGTGFIAVGDILEITE